LLGGKKEIAMELKDLVGKHMLEAVDFSDEKIKAWDDEFEYCQVCRFKLDGVIYMAVEDPSDGYRSSMKDLDVDASATMKNVFGPVEVIARHKHKGEYGEEDDVLELIDTNTGLVVLEVGTENTDDYYPCFVASFHPEAMVINS
jgi:hypothetical protein